jgi:hypothetical protein
VGEKGKKGEIGEMEKELRREIGIGRESEKGGKMRNGR